jgi:hypothetical protein
MNTHLSIRQQAVRRAAEILGGALRLSRRLRVPADELVKWMNGLEQPPDTSFLECVDIILDNEDSIDGDLLRDAALARESGEPKKRSS